MSEYIRTMNNADAFACMYQRGILSAIAAQMKLVHSGFYDVQFDLNRRVVARYKGVEYILGGNYVDIHTRH